MYGAEDWRESLGVLADDEEEGDSQDQNSDSSGDESADMSPDPLNPVSLQVYMSQFVHTEDDGCTQMAANFINRCVFAVGGEEIMTLSGEELTASLPPTFERNLEVEGATVPNQANAKKL